MSRLAALASYARIRAFPYLVRDRAALDAWQARRLARWLRDDVPQVAAFHERAGRPTTLRDLPVMTKADLMADFSRYNRPGLTNEQGWAAFAGSRRIGDLTVGASTGTSGNRGLFVISEEERFAWLGAMLAKAAPDVWRHRDRVAVMLPIDTPLYDSANRTGLLSLRVFDITAPVESLIPDLEMFAPTLLVAPPRILRRLVEEGARIAPRRVFSAAETLDPLDRAAIEAGFGRPLGQIYMATEGLFGVTCRHGRLHLAEDCLHFELEPAGEGLVTPIISDFSRRTQIMARYRMNDLLRLDGRACPCGSPLRVVAEVVGRQDDVLRLRGEAGPVEITPDILRNAIVDADRRITDFRLVQTGPATLALHLPGACGAEVRSAVHRALRGLLDRHGVGPCEIVDREIGADPPGKLRRVRRDWPRTKSEARRD